MEPSKPISIDPSPHIPLQETTDSTVQRLPCSIPYPGPRLPEVGRPLYDLVAREDDQFEGLLSFCSLLGPVLDPHQRSGQPVGADHFRGQLLRGVGDGRVPVVGQLRADDYGGILLLFGQEDAHAAPTAPGRGVDVVAGQVHRCREAFQRRALTVAFCVGSYIARDLWQVYQEPYVNSLTIREA